MMAKILPPIGKVVIVKGRIKYGRIVHTLAAKRIMHSEYLGNMKWAEEKEKWVAIMDDEHMERIKEVADVFSWQEIEYQEHNIYG